MKFVATILGILLLHGCTADCLAQRQRDRSTPTLQSYARLTPLMRAADAGRISAVRNLLSRGADVNEKDPIGITALMVAAGRGHLEVVKVLLAAGADPNAGSGFAHGPIFSVLTMAMNRRNKNWMEVVDTMIAAGARVNPPRDFYISPLIYAISQLRDVVMIKALLERGADVNWRDGAPLWAAVSDGEPDVEIVKVLLAANADPNLRRVGGDGENKISLLTYLEGWLAGSGGVKDEAREEIVRLLKRAGARS
jgi:ankyrin repeat protein